MFSIIDGARLVDSSMSTTHIWSATLDLMLDLSLGGQWAIPCDTNLTLTVTFR